MRKQHSVILFFKHVVTCFLLVVIHIHLHAQIIEEVKITELIERWKNYNLDNSEVRGWRIQLLATVDRRQMESEERKFENKYPDYPTHMVNNQPYFHLKTGAFLTSQKAQAFMKKLQRDYPGAILVEDQMKTEELLLYDQ